MAPLSFRFFRRDAGSNGPSEPALTGGNNPLYLSEQQRFAQFLRQLHSWLEEIYQRGAVGGRSRLADGQELFRELDRELMVQAWASFQESYRMTPLRVDFGELGRAELADAGLIGSALRLKVDAIEDARALFAESGRPEAFQQLVINAEDLLSRILRVANAGDQVAGLRALVVDLRRTVIQPT